MTELLWQSPRLTYASAQEGSDSLLHRLLNSPSLLLNSAPYLVTPRGPEDIKNYRKLIQGSRLGVIIRLQ